MTRLEKKCLISSAGAHGLFVLLLALAPFLAGTRHQPVSLPPINFIPSRLIDGAMSGGGNPAVKEMPKSAPSVPLTLPTPAPSIPAPAPPVTAVEPEPTPKARPEPPARSRKPSETVPAEKTSSKVDNSKPSPDAKPSRKRIELSFEREDAGNATASSSSKKQSAAQARAQAAAAARAAQAAYAARVQSIVGAIGEGVSSSTSIDVPGPGGEAFADYGQWVVAVYHRAWTPPTNLADDSATVEATVVILRSGTVSSFKVSRRSGHAALDKSVERLQQVSSIAPFPEGATDDKRTFIIEFNLRSKRPFQ